jgi:CheY-like chemotaxis protein
MDGACILVVEDNPVNLRLVCDILQYRGHRTLEAGRVEEGREQLRRSVPDLILLDLQIPGGGGELLLREIRENPTLKHLPVIAFTAFAMRGDANRLLKAGFDAYMSKPIDTRTFCPEIEVYLGKRHEPIGAPERASEKALALEDTLQTRRASDEGADPAGGPLRNIQPATVYSAPRPIIARPRFRNGRRSGARETTRRTPPLR